MLCPANYFTGRGQVWLGQDPEALEERDLPCLQGDGSLRGYFIDSVSTSLGESAWAEDNRFLYGLDDARLNEVQSYYVITHMANWLTGYVLDLDDSERVQQLLRADRVVLKFDRAVIESKQLCYSLEQGMWDLSHSLLNVDVMAHEFGHHAVFALNRSIGNSLIHEALADYLAASFTGDPVIEPSQWPGFDRNLDNTRIAPDDLIYKGDYCRSLLERMEAEGIDQVFSSLSQTLAQCVAQNSPAPEPHGSSLILSAALWELRTQIGESSFQPILFQALHNHSVEDTGDLMEALIEADSSGQYTTQIIETFTFRGIAENLGLDFPVLPYAQCP